MMVGGLLSSDLCIVVVLWHGLILACVLASVDVFWCLIVFVRCLACGFACVGYTYQEWIFW